MTSHLAELARAIQSHAPDSHETARRLARAALETGIAPGQVIQEGLVVGMADVGRRFREHEIFVPEVLLSARAMQAALDVLEPALVAAGYEPIGRFLIGTVQGDVHDIGKNLVTMMLRGAGFQVRDLGVNCARSKFEAAIKEFAPDVVGMSALLTTTMPQMERNVRAWTESGLRERFAILVGGAPLDAAWATSIGADGYGANATHAVERALALLAERKSRG
ncbi:MAG: corrinoid protein [Planctomycetes bacterium]|nr:corrinoid protein [Planctomycetota bacterium]